MHKLHINSHRHTHIHINENQTFNGRHRMLLSMTLGFSLIELLRTRHITAEVFDEEAKTRPLKPQHSMAKWKVQGHQSLALVWGCPGTQGSPLYKIEAAPWLLPPHSSVREQTWVRQALTSIMGQTHSYSFLISVLENSPRGSRLAGKVKAKLKLTK